jgi:hypothetical protein
MPNTPEMAAVTSTIPRIAAAAKGLMTGD